MICDRKLWLHEWVCPQHGSVGYGGNNNSKKAGAGKGKDCAESSNDGETEGDDGMEDVYAIGFQELVDLNAVNVAIDIRSQARRAWERDDVVFLAKTIHTALLRWT